MSDSILPSKNPGLSDSPESTNPLPPPASADGVRVEPAGGDELQDTRIPPEQREWVQQQFPVEEMERGVREVQEQGGFAFEDFFEDLVEAVRNGRDRA